MEELECHSTPGPTRLTTWTIFKKLHRPLFLILFLLFSSCFTEVEIKLHYPSAFSTLLTFRIVPCGSYASKFRCTVT